jgi:hypothetical protein
MNTKIESININSFQDFLDTIETISRSNIRLWFRGVSNKTHKLAPSIYRNDFSPSLEESFQNKFKSRALPFLKNRPVENYWEWLFIMQHHGVPTRLLDWSSSALVALGFAIIFRSNLDEDAAVWCLNPIKLNEATNVMLTPLDKIPDISTNKNAQTSYQIDASVKSSYPIAITGPLNNERIAAQKGTFTLFPNSDIFNLEEKEEAHEFLTLLIIKKETIETLKNQLYYLGMTESSIYPDLNHLALEIKREHIESLTLNSETNV